MSILNKEQILAAQDIRYNVISVPEWGGDVRLRSMTGADRDAFEQWMLASQSADPHANLANLRARMVSLSAVDEAGNRLFADGDIEALGAKSAKALDVVYAAASALNALADKDVEALTKPSEALPAAASGST